MTHMTRRILALACTLLAALASGVAPISARASHAPVAPTSPTSPVYRYAPPPLRAASAALLDVTTGRWLLLKDADAPRAQASTTKIMTALVALRYGRLDDVATATNAAVTVGQESGSNMGLVAGEHLSLRDLLYGMLLPSGNDAALTIAARVGGSVPAFVTLMNREAARLGLSHTHFVNPHGLDAPGQYSSARDLVLLARHAMDNATFRQIVSTRAYTIPATASHGAHALTNVNWFVNWYPGADGVKPGMTGDAGLCQVVSARRHGHWLIGAVMDTPDLYTDVRDLMNYGFRDFRWVPSGQPGDTPDAAVPAGTAGDPTLYFPATGHRVRAGFLDYFTRHGGVPVLGLPQTDEFSEDGVTVQYFERARLWWDAASGIVVATPLGQQAATSAAFARPIVPAALLRPVAPIADTAARIYVAVTGHTLRGAILAAYRAEGGNDTFGYPLTEELPTGGGSVRQYFSNAVFSWSPAGGIALAPLGNAALRARGYLR